MSDKGGCSTCSRIFLSLLNITMLLAGLCIIGLSLWLWFDKSFEERIRNNISVEYSSNIDMDNIKRDIRLAITVSFWVLCGSGLAAAIIGFIGTCGALCGSRCITGFYMVLLIIFVLFEIAVGIFILCYRSTIRDGVVRYVQLSSQTPTLPDMDTFRQRYNCCGADGYNTPSCSGLSLPTCTSAVWDRLDFSLMIAGWSLLGIILLQIVSVILSISLIITASSRS